MTLMPTRVEIEREGQKYHFDSPDVDYAERMLAKFRDPRFESISHSTGVRVFVDVGAHLGETVFPLALLWPNTTFYCIEPFPESFRYLVENTRQFRAVHCFNLAVSDKTEEVALALPTKEQRDVQYDGPHATGLYSVFGKGEGQFVADSLRLDDIIPADVQVDFLKVDVEGYELEVLQGAPRILGHDKPLLAVECHMQGMASRTIRAIPEWLRKQGYFAFGQFGADVLFGHRTYLSRRKDAIPTQEAVLGRQAQTA